MEQVDLTNCDREPIHLLGKVQSFGFLIATTPDWIISHVSRNVSQYLSVTAEEMLGKRALDFIPAESIHAIRNRLQFVHPRRGVEVVYELKLEGTDRSFDVSIHSLETNIVMEFEPAGVREGETNDTANVRNAIDRMADLPQVEAIYSQAVRFIKMVTGFDRVMLYKFATDGSGEVVAEAKKYGMAPFLNLRYPATDIPRQARALYLENPIRLIADVADDGVAVVEHRKSEAGVPIDLSGSRLRSVSPIHLEYLRNMGVGASMSISVIVNGELWGLIACHHNEALVPSMRYRNCALLFGQMLSLVLQTRFAAEEKSKDVRVAELTTEVSRALSTEVSSPELLRSSAESFSEILQADGFCVIQEDILLHSGLTPEDEAVRTLCDVLNALPGNEVFATNSIASIIEGWDGGGASSAGVLAIPISRSPRDYILFFREELVRKVNWAGNPEKPVTLGPNGARLTPRKSFETWQQTVHGQSEDWNSSDLRVASQLRIMLLEVVLRMTDEAGRQRKAANEKQELLIAELNHRVRNILGLVRGLISQTNSGTDSTADFVKKLDSRVQSLARAHDQITRHNWSPASFRELIETESESYLLDKKDRVIVSGPQVLLTPPAFSAMALVMHEMITNSAKYGAISDQRGSVEIELEIDGDGALLISWKDIGGPPVKTPERRGFGSTIIERTVPFELKGEAEIDYPVEGVTAFFKIPANHVVPGRSGVVPSAKKSSKGKEPINVPQSILIVEDNLIIAMDAEDIFQSLGADEVCVVASIDAALSEIEDRTSPFEFALLDINLGSDTSYEVASRLLEMGVPFVFASGYGEDVDAPEELAGALRISKPYDKDVLSTLFSQAREG
ncbi:HWE histidine kinase domain-containing protein [Roseibium sp. FZY0029]|uniref:HWE histidine kinase domain-containing protein n=1 Tax=Roseibium sp. FZY0029 TaxID=3116647 RepID=UPI002EB0DC30|nr:HWE histidine kinase domain-containing protein [Roseibium sp. FZY0029]